ncbi:hypothetical protein OIO90_002213 [Microbotryomycetes sp. JL221]|nr:hypothetical protein OIO90_002213 [Microbotryomycetes sp. JL221]
MKHTQSVFNDSRPMADLTAAFLLYIRDAQTDSEQLDQLDKTYSLLEDCIKQAEKVFARGETGWFVQTLRQLSTVFVDVALRLGRLAEDPNLTKAGEAARVLSRPMAVAANDRTGESPTKRDALFFLANLTFRIYFAMNNLRLCDTIINNTNNSSANIDQTKNSFPKCDRSAFCYYRGRLFLYQRRLPHARNELRKSLELCHSDHWHNGRLILIYLTVASLPLGHFPSIELLRHFNLEDYFSHLIQALAVGSCKGNFVHVLSELDRHQAWHRSKGNYLLLREKLEETCWRNLVRRTLFVTTNGQPMPPTGPPTLSLTSLATAAQISFNDPTIDVDDAESMSASMIEQGYIKAYVLHSKRLLVLQKGQQVGLPPISQIKGFS